MPIDAERLLAHRFAPLRASYTRRDTILYALGVGLGADPVDEADLDYLLETRGAVLPAFVGTLASPGMWIRDPSFGVDFARLVHSEQFTLFHRPLPTEAIVEATPRVAAVHDRGEGRGAVVVVERIVADATDGEAYATIRQTLLLRGDGGFGGAPPITPAVPMPPDRPADHIVESAVSPRAALIYRLSGDRNPLHAEPAVARAAGFDRPILHGLATYGLAAHLVARMAGKQPKAVECRFSGIVFPGDRIALSGWREGDRILFEAHVDDRKVLDRGVASFQSATPSVTISQSAPVRS